jgi:hypothetical protein
MRPKGEASQLQSKCIERESTTVSKYTFFPIFGLEADLAVKKWFEQMQRGDDESWETIWNHHHEQLPDCHERPQCMQDMSTQVCSKAQEEASKSKGARTLIWEWLATVGAGYACDLEEM